MSIDIKELGVSQEDLKELVVKRLVEKLLSNWDYDDDEGYFRKNSDFARDLNKRVKDAVNDKIHEIFNKHVMPDISRMIEETTLQATNEWGEARGAKLTFKEYLAKRANEFMLERVNFEGRSKGEKGFGSWTEAGTRIQYAIDKHFQYHIENLMKSVVQEANNTITEGIKDAVSVKLDEIKKKLSVKVSTGR